MSDNNNNTGSEIAAENKKSKRSSFVSWPAIAIICFSTVWNFNNNVSGFGYFGGTRVIIPWILIFLLFLLPYTLMVGELGSTFKNKEAGVTSWIFETIGPKLSFFAGWIGWAVVLPYLSQRPSLVIVAFNWAVNQNGDISNIDPMIVQLIGVGIFLVCVLLASRGFSFVKTIASIAGTCLLIMFFLYIILGISAAFMPSSSSMVQPIEWKIENFFPNDIGAIMSLAILIFGVGGAEKVSPYIKRMKKPEKDFPKGMILLFCLVTFVALVGCIAMAMMWGQFGQIFGIEDLQGSGWLTNGQYACFQMLGEYYGLGNTFMIMYACVKFFGDLSCIIVMVDIPLRMFAGTSDGRFIPRCLFKQNKHGSYPWFLLIESIVVITIMIIPALGIESTDMLIKWLIDLNSICMPLFYICCFLAYVTLRGTKKGIAISEKNTGFVFIKNHKLATFVGSWCIFITFAAIVMQILNSADLFTMLLNIITPFILLGVGLIFPVITTFYNKRHGISAEEAARDAG